MFEKFTEGAIKVIMLSQEEARRMGHNFVGTDQPLLSIEHIINISLTAKTATCSRWNVYTTAAHFKSTTKWIQTNLKTIYMKHCNSSFPESIVPDHFVPEVKFNTTVDFQNQKHDPHLDNATSSVSGCSSSPANSWASVVSGYMGYLVPSKLTSHTPSSISSLNNFNKTLQDINKSIETICERIIRLKKDSTSKTRP